MGSGGFRKLSGRIGSGGFLVSRVGSGRVEVAGHPDPIRATRKDPTGEEGRPFIFLRTWFCLCSVSTYPTRMFRSVFLLFLLAAAIRVESHVIFYVSELLV